MEEGWLYIELEVGAFDSGLQAGALDSGLGARDDTIRPITPTTFPILVPNPLFKKDGLQVGWSWDPFAWDI